MLHLASKSPRRSDLLARLGLEFGVLELDIPEQRQPAEPAEDYVRRVAREKAGAGLLQVVAVPDVLVLGADTEVVLDDEVFGKPRDAADAAAMLRRLSGRTHQVISAVSLLSAGREAQAVSRSEVTFAELSDGDIDGYVATGEPHGQGRRLRDPGRRTGLHRASVRQLFRGDGLAAVRNRGTAAPVRLPAHAGPRAGAVR